jgi:hypothetical protein
MTGEAPSVWRERLTSPLTWHYVGFAVLLAVVIVLGVRLGMDWTATDSHSKCRPLPCADSTSAWISPALR